MPQVLGDRLTVTLAPGQRGLLEEIALRNHTTLAWVVRLALLQFAENHATGRDAVDLDLSRPHQPT